MKRLIYKWLNRRSQRRSFGWTRFAKLWHEQWEMPEPQIIEQGRPRYGSNAGGESDPVIIRLIFKAMKGKVDEKNDNRLRARITEEPIAGKPHDGICEGAPGDWRSYLNML